MLQKFSTCTNVVANLAATFLSVAVSMLTSSFRQTMPTSRREADRAKPIVMSDALAAAIQKDGGAYKFKTVGGCEFTAEVRDGKVGIEDGKGNFAAVTIADVKQSNGVIHVIDTVLLPAN